MDRKLADKNKYEMIYMLWKECMTQNFYKHICEKENFLYLKSKNVLQPKLLEIMTEFLNEGKKNKDLWTNLSSYQNVFQYVYSSVFPEIYYSTEKHGFDLKSNFHIIFKRIRTKNN